MPPERDPAMMHRNIRITKVGDRMLDLLELRQRVNDLVNPSQVLINYINKEIANANATTQEPRQQEPQQLSIPE